MTSVDDTSCEPSQTVIRIDGAHRLAGSNESVEGVTATALQHRGQNEGAADHALASFQPVQGSESAAEQMQVQAGQLARHLQDRRRDVDHRESELNARIAQLENELRLSRLWLREQNQEFTQRETELRQQLSEYESRVADLALAEEALEDARRKWTDEARGREEKLARRERQVQDSQQQIKQEAERMQLVRDANAQSDDSRNQARLELERLQKEHRQRFQDWQQEHGQWQATAAQRQQELDAKLESLNLRNRRWQEEREQQQQTLQRQRDQLDQRLATVERARTDVLRLHREALEMRLVTEQLWGQLAEHALPVDLIAGSMKLRGQLADEFRFVNEELEQRRLAIQKLVAQLEEKQQDVVARRRELTAWFGRRQTELAQKGAELTLRDQKVTDAQQRMDDQQLQWQLERRQLQQQLLELQARVEGQKKVDGQGSRV